MNETERDTIIDAITVLQLAVGTIGNTIITEPQRAQMSKQNLDALRDGVLLARVALRVLKHWRPQHDCDTSNSILKLLRAQDDEEARQ